MKNINPIYLLALTLFSIIACQPKADTPKSMDALPTEITLSTFQQSIEFPDASISSMDYQKGMFKFGIQGNYQLGQQTPDAPQKMCANSDKGQHIHLIVDNKPYEAKYVADFHHLIDNGSHYVLAFLSRSYHESIKNAKAYSLIKAEIVDSSFKKLEPVITPMLFYSRPKGAYVGNDTKKVMLDFFLVNCQLGSKYKIKAEVNDTVFTLDSWQPYYLEGLPMGENKIRLSLLDSLGGLVNTPLNPVERSFTLQAEPGK